MEVRGSPLLPILSPYGQLCPTLCRCCCLEKHNEAPTLTPARYIRNRGKNILRTHRFSRAFAAKGSHPCGPRNEKHVPCSKRLLRIITQPLCLLSLIYKCWSKNKRPDIRPRTSKPNSSLETARDAPKIVNSPLFLTSCRSVELPSRSPESILAFPLQNHAFAHCRFQHDRVGRGSPRWLCRRPRDSSMPVCRRQSAQLRLGGTEYTQNESST